MNADTLAPAARRRASTGPPGGALPSGDEQRVRGIRTGYTTPAQGGGALPRSGGLRAGLAPDGDRGLSAALLAVLGQPGEPPLPPPGQRPHRLGSAKFSAPGVVRRIDASKFDPAAVAAAAAAEERRRRRQQQELEAAADAAAAAAAASAPAVHAPLHPPPTTGLRTGIDPHAAARRQATFDVLRHTAPAGALLSDDGACAAADATLAPVLSRLGSRKFAARGFLRRLWREDPAEVAAKAAGERARQEVADARAAERRARLASAAYGEGYDVITLADVAGDSSGCSGSGGGARSRSAPPRATGGLRYLRSGAESAQQRQQHDPDCRVANMRLLDSALRYHAAGASNTTTTTTTARAGLLAREGLSEVSVATLRRSSLLGLGRLDLPSAGAADALAAAAYGADAPSPAALEAAAAVATRRGTPTAWSPQERTSDELAAAGAAATAAASARLAARSQRAPNRVFDASQCPTLLPAVAGVTRYATPEDEVVAATAAARKLAAAGAAASSRSSGGNHTSTAAAAVAAHSRTASTAASAAAAARQRDIDAVRALVI
jgi:trimeric autotransporter adhesin